MTSFSYDHGIIIGVVTVIVLVTLDSNLSMITVGKRMGPGRRSAAPPSVSSAKRCGRNCSAGKVRWARGCVCKNCPARSSVCCKPRANPAWERGPGRYRDRAVANFPPPDRRPQRRQPDSCVGQGRRVHRRDRTGIAPAAVSLLVGGIVIMNIMLVPMTERTREMGIRLAIGALEKEILLQFLVEVVVLSSTGELIGIVLALLTSRPPWRRSCRFRGCSICR